VPPANCTPHDRAKPQLVSHASPPVGKPLLVARNATDEFPLGSAGAEFPAVRACRQVAGARQMRVWTAEQVRALTESVAGDVVSCWGALSACRAGSCAAAGWGWWRPGRRWPAGRWGPCERCFDVGQCAREGVGLWARNLVEQSGEPITQERLRGGERPHACPGQRERLAPPVLGELSALKQSGVGEAGQQLRHGWPGHARALGQLRRGHAFAGDRAQREELSHRQRRFVAGEEPVNPAADERGDREQRLGGLVWGVSRRRH